MSMSWLFMLTLWNEVIVYTLHDMIYIQSALQFTINRINARLLLQKGKGVILQRICFVI